MPRWRRKDLHIQPLFPKPPGRTSGSAQPLASRRPPAPAPCCGPGAGRRRWPAPCAPWRPGCWRRVNQVDRTSGRTMQAVSQGPDSLTTALQQHIRQAIAAAGGWIGFDRFMELALYTPGLGYYANDSAKFGSSPASGSDFVTAPELTPLFGQTLAVQLEQALQATGTQQLWEFGAGSGALALQLLDALGARVQRYTIVDLSGHLRARQQTRLAAHAHKLRWVDALPEKFSGVVLANEVLDAMPVQLLARHGGEQGGVWHERGVALGADGALAWADRPTGRRPPAGIAGPQDYLTEIHTQGEGFIRTLADRLERGAVVLLDYGFCATHYYHPPPPSAIWAP